MPVVPTSQVFVSVLSYAFDLGQTLGSVRNATELRDYACDAQFLRVLLPPLGIDGVVELALESAQGKRTIGMVVE